MRRLLNALQRGGVTAEINPDIWGVWRLRDRRKRRIGSLSGAEIDMLRLHAFLMRAGNRSGGVLIWRDCGEGAVERAIEVLSRSLSARSFLDQLIQFDRLGRERAMLAQIARAVREDFRLCSEAGSPSIDLDTVCDRLSAITCLLSDEDCRFLHQFLNCNAAKSDLAAQFALRPDAVRTKAISILRAIAEIYRRGLQSSLSRPLQS